MVLRIAFLLLISFTIIFTGVNLSRADELDNVTNQLNQQQKQLSDLEKRQQQLSRDISSASLSLSQVSTQLTDAEKDLAKIEKDLTAKEKELAQWEAERDFLARTLYKQSRVSSFEVAFSSDDLGESAKQLQYYNESLENLKNKITLLSGEVGTFKSNKATAQRIRDELATLRSQYQAGLSSSQRQLSSTSSQLSQVKASIKNLTAKQEQLILAKFAASGGSETVGENPAPSEPIPNPSFSRRPAFMIGAYGYTHRIGMSQYGAYGRAKKGQSYTTILKAYYGGNVSVSSYTVPSKIKVDGIGKIPFEDKYLDGIAEMPSSWSMNALKSQAIAARTYALYRTSWKNYIGRESTYLAQKSICPTTSCQVYSSKKATPGTWEYSVSSRWREAVDATRGIVIKDGGIPIAAFYHSTAGGYTISKRVWIDYWEYSNPLADFCSISSCGADKGKAYEQISNAPWYHTGWGSRNGTKGQYQPWMTDEEFADIFNAYLLSKQSDTQNHCRADDDTDPYKNTGSYTPCLSPIDKGGWSMQQVRGELQDNKDRYPNVSPLSSVSATFVQFTSNKVNTQYIYANHSGVSVRITAKDFLPMFNLRARGTLMIPWTYRFDIGSCSGSNCTNPTFK